MNTRIQELADKAGIGQLIHVGHGEWDTKLSDKELKFAELIVKECICLVLNGKYDEEKFRADDEFHCGHNIALDGTAEGMAKHFGVE
jgi:hypothetical protein